MSFLRYGVPVFGVFFLACGPDEAGSRAIERGIYDVEITAVNEGCEPARSTEPYRDRIDPQEDGAARLPFALGPLSGGLSMIEAHLFEPVAGRPGHFAAVTKLGPAQGECGRWQGTFSEAVVGEAGQIDVDVSLAWVPAQACPADPTIPAAACTSELHYEFTLVEACAEECELEVDTPGPVTCVCP